MYKFLLLLILALINFLFSFTIVFRNRRSASNLLYAAVIFFSFIWCLGLALFINSKQAELAIVWARIYYGAAAFIAFFYFYYSRSFPRPSPQRKLYMDMLYLGTLLVVIYLIFFTSLHVENVVFEEWGNRVQLGPAYPLYVIFFIFYIVAAFYNWWSKYKYLNLLLKLQLRYVMIGTGVALLFGSFFNLFLPIFNYKYIWAGPLFMLLMLVVFVFAIVRYRLMNIKLVLQKSFLYFLLVAVISTIFAFTSYLLTRYIHVESRIGELLIIMGVSFIVVLGIDPLKRLLAKITDDIFFKDKIDYQKVLRDLSIVIAKEIDLEILIASLRSVISEDLKISAVDILVKKEAGLFAVHAGGKKFRSDNPVFEFLTEQHDIIITDEFYRMTFDMPDGPERNNKQHVLDELERQGVELLAPVYLEGQLRAAIILGAKRSGDIYSTEEVDFFNSLSPQVAVAVEKSQLYESIGEFNLKLQDKVNMATKKYKELNVQLQDANEHLKQLDKAKSEFLSIASHQLRTPISAIKGYLSMMLEGDFGAVPEKQRKVISDIFESSARLARLINIFLNVSRIESGRFKLDKTLVDINALVESVIKELKGQAQSKKLELTFKSDSYLPKAYIDSDKVREVILNLVDNAIKYTPAGKVHIATYQKDKELHFEIKDTGVGIRQHEVKSLFKKFVRGTGIAQVNTQGSGLGLYIAQRVVGEHDGKIWAESDGLGKGSTFHCVLPLVQPPSQPAIGAPSQSPTSVRSAIIK